jgi:hypothetical protein
MSSGTAPEGLGVSDLKVERDAKPNEYRYQLLLTQGGQRRQDFKGRLQLVAHVLREGQAASLTVPEAPAAPIDFRFYQKVEGRFAVPAGAVLKSVDIRVVALPGGQVKLSRTVNLP